MSTPPAPEPESDRRDPVAGPPGRAARRNRLVLGGALGLAALAVGVSVALLGRDVPGLDIDVERAEAVLLRPVTTAAPAPAPTTTAAPATTAATAAEPTPTTAPPAEAAVVPATTVEPDADPAVGAGDAAIDGDDAPAGDDGSASDQGDPAGAADDGASDDGADPPAEEPVAPVATEPETPTTAVYTPTAAPTATEGDPTLVAPTGPATEPPAPTAPSTTAPPTTVSTTPNGTVPLTGTLPCAGGAALGARLTATPSGKVRSMVVSGLPASCKKAKVRVALLDRNGAPLAALNATAPSSNPATFEITGWPSVAATSVASVALAAR